MRHVLTAALGVLAASCAAPDAMDHGSRDASLAARRRIIDSASGLRVDEWAIDSRRLDLDTEHAWSVRKYVLRGGRQEGVDALEVDNGALRFVVLPTRGMGLWSGRAGDVRLGWDSPVKEAVHPALVNLESRGGLGWLEGFGEWINRCGLASNGLPGTDVVTSNTGEPVEVTLTLHGKIAYVPASQVEVIIEPPPWRRIRIRGVVDETMMFGTQLRLVTEIWTTPGARSIHIDDEVHNLSATEQEFQLLYHANFGPPLLEDGARFVAPVEWVAPRDARAAEGEMAGWDVYGPPQAGYVEQVYFLRLHSAEDGRTEALLLNRDGDRGVSLAFSTRELPFMTVWKNTAAEADGYVTGLEPGTGYPNLRSVERRAGRVPRLEGGGVYKARLTVTVLSGREEVAESQGRVEAIRAGRAPAIEERRRETREEE